MLVSYIDNTMALWNLRKLDEILVAEHSLRVRDLRSTRSSKSLRMECRILHAVPFFSLGSWETGASEMRDRARDWSATVPLARSSPSITVDEKGKGLRAVWEYREGQNGVSYFRRICLMLPRPIFLPP